MKLVALAVIFSTIMFNLAPAQAEQRTVAVPGPDAPALAAPGPFRIGVRTLTLVDPGQPDLMAADPKTGAVPLNERRLIIDLWYPAKPAPGAPGAVYSAAFSGEPPHPPVAFTVPGLAVRDAPPTGRGYPLVIVSHGYGNDPAAMTWLTENLASKGYVVAGIHHQDPNPYVDGPVASAAPSLRRPLDIVFTARELQVRLGALIDPARTALIGYSMGGYGVITAGGASLDPAGPAMRLVPGDWLRRYARGAPKAAELRVAGLKAIVAMAPAGNGPVSAWGPAGLAAISAPVLLIQGDSDPVVDYITGGRAIFAGLKNSDRYLLTYRHAGHAVGLNPAPPEMRRSMWDLDWFEDPVWRPDRIDAINLHFITAFLDRYVRGDVSRAAYLDVAVVASDDGVWPDAGPYAAFSPGTGTVTVWKGFQRRHVRGLELRHAAAGQDAPR